MIRERRSFSSDFKKIIESRLSGSATQAELAREHRITGNDKPAEKRIQKRKVL